MLYNHIQYLTWATGGTESQNSFETLDYYATDLALRKLQALYPNASYANTAGTGVNRVEQLLGLIPDTMGGGVGFNYYSPYATSTYTDDGLTADGLGEAHGALSSGFDGGGYGQLIPWIATQVASMAALDPEMTADFPGTNSTILSLVEAKANATINSFDQFISPTYNASVNSSGVVTSDTYGFDPESWITYRDPKNPNTYAGGFNFNSQYLASQPNGALDNSFALRSAYLETQYNITPTTGVTFSGAISNSTLDYLRSLSAYEATIKSLIGVSPSTLTPLPDEPGQPGYTFADVQNGAVAIVNNGEQLFMNIDWRNYEYNNNSLVNLVPSQVLRYDYTTSTIEQAGQVQLPYNSATVQSDGNLSATSMFGVDVARLGNYLVILNDSTNAYSATLPVGTGLAEDLISHNLYDLSSTGSAPTTVSVAAGKAAILWLNASSVISSLGTGSDVGTVGMAGSDSYSGGVYTVTGAGADMGETADAFHFVPTSASGNSTITAQVLTQTAASSLAQAGVMVRDGISASAAFAAVLRTPGGGVRFVYRTTAGAAAAWVAAADPLSPVYVKLTRSGNNVSGYYSTNGITWTQIGSTQSIAMTAPEIGLAVSSHSTTATSTATFGSVTVNAAIAPTVATAASASATTVTGITVNLSVLGADAGGQSGLTYTWAMSGTSPDQVAFSANGTNAAQSTTVTFSAAGIYNFVATIANASGASVTSTVSVTVAQKMTSISVSPATAVVPSGDTDLFYATESDQFGMPMQSPAALTWSVTSGGIGSIDQSGLYTAPASIGGLATVLAMSGTLCGTSTIAVQAPIGIFTGTQAINTSPAGSASYNSTTGTYTVSGSGSDIWGTSDQFQYVYESLTDDGTVTAYVASMTDTNVWTKCGIMVRDSLNAGGAYAFLMTTPTTTEGDAFQYRGSDGASSGQDIQTTGTGKGGPEWLRLTRAGNTFTAYLSTNGTTWTAYGTPQTITMGSTIYVGLVVSSHVSGTLATATFTNVSVAPATRTFAANQDIGNPSPTGSYSESNGTITLSGGGSDIYGTSDQFQYGYNEVTGNGSLITEVDSVTNTNTYTKAGIMLRNTLAANSTNVSLFLTPPNGNSDNGIGFEWRSSTGGSTTETVATGLAAPYWLKLTDTNGSFTAFYSPTGASWTQIGSAEAITMNADIFAGVAVTAHANGSLATATFNNVSSTLAAATIPPPNLSEPASASANPVTGKTVVLSATATDPIEGTSILTYTWSAIGEPPANMTFSANGTNLAANTTVTFTGAGTYLFQVTIQDLNGLQATGTVAVTVNQTLTSIAVTPATSASPSVGPGGSIAFSAVALDQCGLPMATQSAFTWSASSGTINALSGAYTAAANVQGTSNVTITASSSSLSGTATLSAVNQAPLIASSSGIAVTPSTLTAALSLAAADDGGSANLSYQWSATGPASVSFSVNNSNAASSTVATFSKAGTYTVTAVVTDLGAASITTTTTLNVDPVWLSPTAIATWNPSTGVLTVTGPASIIADPGTDEPIIEASGTAAVVTLDPASGTDIHIGGLSLTDSATATETSLGSARSATNYHILVIGTTGATTAPIYTIDSTSTLDLADNDMAILYGSGTSPMPLVSGASTHRTASALRTIQRRSG